MVTERTTTTRVRQFTVSKEVVLKTLADMCSVSVKGNVTGMAVQDMGNGDVTVGWTETEPAPKSVAPANAPKPPAAAEKKPDPSKQ